MEPTNQKKVELIHSPLSASNARLSLSATAGTRRLDYIQTLLNLETRATPLHYVLTP